MLFYKSGHLFIKNKAGSVITCYNTLLNSAELFILPAFLMLIVVFNNEVSQLGGVIKKKAGSGITRYNKVANSAELVINLDVVMIKHFGWNFPRSDHLTLSTPILLKVDCAVIKDN